MMLSKAFGQRYNVAITSDDLGQYILNYCPPLMPWVLMYVIRHLKKTPILHEIDKTQLELLLNGGTAIQDDMSQTLDTMVSKDSFSYLLETLPQNNIDSLEDSEAPVIKLINTMLSEAISMRASDIHIETYQQYFQVRYRVDGVMQEISRGDARLGAPLISRLKILSRLDIAERRLPQDGRFLFPYKGREIDIRLSIIPVSYGERAVLRLLDQEQLELNYETFGIPSVLSAHLHDLIHRPHGIILVTGPTGSGKSSTLYASLKELNQCTRTILTIEDPVEYKLPGISQTQVNSRIDLSFARGLRAALRQDPDVVMIGEIRDTETARVAVQASLTGHLVLSTLHTNSAIGSIPRLYDMGVEPWLLASSIIALLSQRLVRKLCPDCKEERSPSEYEKEWLGCDFANEQLIYGPAGCEKCSQSGYLGRIGLYELVIIDTGMRELIQRRASIEELERCARKSLPGLLDDARDKVLCGITSIEEAMRVVEGEE